MEKNKEVFIFYLSEGGKRLAESISSFFEKARVFRLRAEEKEVLKNYWERENLLIFIMALGVVARFCKDLISGKDRDPGVIVIDEAGHNVITYLGGHYAEANKITLQLATYLSAHPVITTASDNFNLPALDLWIKENRFILKNPKKLYEIMSKFNENKKLKVYIEEGLNYPLIKGLSVTSSYEEADIVITYKKREGDKLFLIPKCLYAGVGFHEVLSEEDFERLIKLTFEETNLEFEALRAIATLDKKAHYLPLKNFCQKYNLGLIGFSKEELSQIKTPSYSEEVFKNFGISSVSEATSLLASKGKLILPKKVYKDFTIAISLKANEKKGKLYVVGIGPGSKDFLTLKALKILTQVSAIVGYKTYVKQIYDLIKNKEIYEFSMTQEIDRVKKAIELALSGKDTALVSGGDPGIYGITGLLLEIIDKNKIDLEVEIIPGVSALNAANALLGAPLGNDFAVISLSDRLTPWEVIEKRLLALSETEIPIVIYNPRSKGRKLQFERALQIFREKRPSETPVAIVNSASREEEEVLLTNLHNLPIEKIGMNSLLIIGGKDTQIIGKYLVALRGYEKKYGKKYEISASSF